MDVLMLRPLVTVVSLQEFREEESWEYSKYTSRDTHPDCW